MAETTPQGKPAKCGALLCVGSARARVHGHDWNDWYQAESALLHTVNHEVSSAGEASLAVVAVGHNRSTLEGGRTQLYSDTWARENI